MCLNSLLYEYITAEAYIHTHRPVDCTEAGGSEGDGEGMCLRSYTPRCTVSEEVVGGSHQGPRYYCKVQVVCSMQY